MRPVGPIVLAVLVLASLGVGAPPATTQTKTETRWVVTRLGALGGEESQANGINELGHVVGSAEKRDGSEHAFVWRNGRVFDLHVSFGGPNSYATAVNEHGQIVGAAETALMDSEGLPISHGFLWQKGRATDLGSFVPEALNERGQLVGVAPSGRAAVWQRGKITNLGRLPGATFCGPLDINERGQVAGVCFADDYSHLEAFLWADGVMRDLGSLGNVGGTDAVIALNDKGQVVGARMGRAFVWENGKYRYLPKARGTRAGDINERGDVVGWRVGDTIRALAWQAGRVSVLPSLSGMSSYAVSLNNAGQAAGWSFEAAGARHAVVWTVKR